MFPFFKKKNDEPFTEFLPLESIREIGSSGILYLDIEGNLKPISYADAHKGWCKSKKLKKSRVKYICDRTKSDGWKLIFYTNPQIIFHADPNRESLWMDILNRIALLGYASLDWD